MGKADRSRRRCAAWVAVAFLAVGGEAEARRLALVIGNDSYTHVEPLHNARADAAAVAAALRSLGYDVTERTDLGLGALKSALREFKGRVGGGDEVVFYYAGHGVQFDGTNYLVPTDLVAESAEQVADDAVPLQRVLDDLRDQKARFALAIVDACRDNPFKGQGRAIAGRGLAPVQAATGQMILYSAGAGQSALDRLGAGDHDPNGLFTRVLIQEMSRPGVPVDRLMKNVQSKVVDLARGVHHEQVPALYDQSIGEFYFRPGPAADGETAVPAPAAAAPLRTPSAGELDESFWGRVRDSTDAQDFRDYAAQFPKGAHVAEATLMVRRLTRPAAPAMPQASPPAGNAASVPAPVPAPATASGAGLAGKYTGYITTTLVPGTPISGTMLLQPDGSFFYQGSNGSMLRGTFDFTSPANVTGVGMTELPKRLGLVQMRYADGTSSTPVRLRGQYANGQLQGNYTDKFETGTFSFSAVR